MFKKLNYNYSFFWLKLLINNSFYYILRKHESASSLSLKLSIFLKRVKLSKIFVITVHKILHFI